MRPERGPPSRPSRRTHVRVEPGAKPFVDDLLLGRGFVRSRAAPSLRSIESQPSTQGFVFLLFLFPHHPKRGGTAAAARAATRALFGWTRGGRARACAFAPAVAAAVGGTRDPPAVGREVSLCPSPDGGLLRSSGEAPRRLRAGAAAFRSPAGPAPSSVAPPIRALAKPRVGTARGRRRGRRRRWRRRPRAMAGLARVLWHAPVPSWLEVLSRGGG